MTRLVEPTLNELVGLGWQDPLDEFFPTTFASSSTTYIPLSPPPPPPPFFPSLSPSSPSIDRIRMEDLEKPKGRLSRRALSSPYPRRSPRASEKSRPFGPQFVNSEMFLFKYWSEENFFQNDESNSDRTAITTSTGRTRSERRTYFRKDDRWVDPWYIAANQRPPWWRRANYKHRGINWQEVDPSGRMPLHWMKQYGIEQEANETATSLVVSPSTSSANATPRALAITVPSLTNSSSSQPILTPSSSAAIIVGPSEPSQKQKVVVTSREAAGKTSSAALDIRKVAASNARMVAIKQLRRESSNEKIAVT